VKKTLLAAALALTGLTGTVDAAVVGTGDYATFYAGTNGANVTIFDFYDGIASGTVPGTSYSTAFTLSSQGSGDVADSTSGAGPAGSGILRVDFASLVSAFAIQSSGLADVAASLRVYGVSGLLQSFNLADISTDQWEFRGFFGNAGEQIAAFEVEGSQYELTKLKYLLDNPSPVPVPAAGLLLVGALGGLGALRRFRKA
jgi:hypothetical protein